MQMWKCSVLKGWHWEEQIRDSWELKCRLRPDDPEEMTLAVLDIRNRPRNPAVSGPLHCDWAVMHFERDLCEPIIFDTYYDADGREVYDSLDEAKQAVEEAVVARLVDLQHQVELLRTIFEA